MRSRLVITTLLACLLVLLLLPAVAQAWSNGDDHGNGFGTHDWVLQEANRLAARQNAGWVKLRVALPRTDDPDTVFHDTYYHVYDVWGASTYGDAPKKVSEYYGKALAARKAGDWMQASRFVGLMAHYYADICNPIHTDQTVAEDRMHSSYETKTQTYTDSVGENRSWITYDGYRATTNVVGFTKTTASAGHKYYSALVKGYNSGGMNATVLSITKKSLNRAANGLADLIISIKNKVPGK
jgi:hypothetical protein